MFRRVYIHEEIEESTENYNNWFKPEMPHTFFAMYARHKTCYRKGE